MKDGRKPFLAAHRSMDKVVFICTNYAVIKCCPHLVSCPDLTLSRGKGSGDHERFESIREIAQWSPDPFSHERVGSGHETSPHCARSNSESRGLVARAF